VGFFYIMHIVVCALLVIVILFQDGKTGGLVSVADSSQAVFGAKGASNFLAKLTTGLAIVFMIFSLALAFQSAPSNESIASDHTPKQEQTPAVSTPAEEDIPVEVSGEGEQGQNFVDNIDKVEVIKGMEDLPPEVREGVEKQQQKDAEKKQEGDPPPSDGENQ